MDHGGDRGEIIAPFLRGKVYHLDFGGCMVRFPGFDQKLFLVVVDGFQEETVREGCYLTTLT